MRSLFRKRGFAAIAVGAAAVGTVVFGVTPASAVTSYNLMLRVGDVVNYIQIVPEVRAPSSRGCAAVQSGKWTDAKYRVYEGYRYSFQALATGQDDPAPCTGGSSRYLGPSSNSPLTIQHVATKNYWVTISLH
jgi:hypothetical protein